MQDTSNMLTRWVIALQSFGFTVKHEPGKLHVVPDALDKPRLCAFEQQEEMEEPKLAPICRNVPDDPAFRMGIPCRAYQVSADKLDELKPVRSDRELFNTASAYVSVTNLFESVDHRKDYEQRNEKNMEGISSTYLTPKHRY